MNETTITPNPALEAAKTKLIEQTKGIPGVYGVGIDGDNLRVYVKQAKVAKGLPAAIDDIKVVVSVIGPLKSSKRKPTAGAFGGARVGRAAAKARKAQELAKAHQIETSPLKPEYPITP